jgi:sulfatase maturation enzyme AslB (radical SAM superfamily)
MKIQSLSISVPSPTKKGKCINNCKFCCSNSHEQKYENCLNLDNFTWGEKDYLTRLYAAKEKGVDTIILTGEIEPLQNKSFINKFVKLNNSMNNPFRNIELQTTGVFLNEENLEWLRNYVGVTTISLSVNDLFDDERNSEIIGIPNKLKFKISELASLIKKFRFNLRLSINMVAKPNFDYINIFKKAKELNANQITIRRLWDNGTNSVEDNWIRENKVSDIEINNIINFIVDNGRKLHKLTSGAYVYTIDGMSTVVDLDCMDDQEKEDDEIIRYLILRENGRLYTHWDDDGSLWF